MLTDFLVFSSFAAVHAVVQNRQATQAGFVFHAQRADAARLTGRAGAWPFWAVHTRSEFGELSSL